MQRAGAPTIAPDVLEQVWEKSTITGDRINGLLDGVAGDWFYRFDTRKPRYENGLPLTLVIARHDLLEILRDAVGAENIEMETVVAKYENAGDRVRATSPTAPCTRDADRRTVFAARCARRCATRTPRICRWRTPGTRCTPPSVIIRRRTRAAAHGRGEDGLPGVPRPQAVFREFDVGNGQQQYYVLDVPPGGEDKYACEIGETTARCSWIASRAGARRCWSAWCTSPRTWSVATCSTCCRIRGGWTGMALLGDRPRGAAQPGQGGGQAIESAYARRRALQVRG